MLKNRPDLIKHFAVGFVFGVLTAFAWVFLLFGSLVFFGKEVFDMYKPKPTDFDWLDILADYLGLATGLILTTIIWDYLKIC